MIFPQLKNLSVYIHIPFCDTRCRYCNFYFETTKSSQIISKTLDSIISQASHYWPKLGNPALRTLYIGGGTPSKIPMENLESFVSKLKTIFKNEPALEFAFEANPEHINTDYLKALENSGITRLSLGVQSLNDEVLSSLGRQANRETILRAFESITYHQAHSSKPFSINLDFITGIPGQKVDEVAENCKLASFADHISLYALTIEEKTPLAQAVNQGKFKPLSPDSHEEIWESAHTYLCNNNYRPYEVSNYARPGFESKHNLVYWNMQPYLGLGPGAVSTLPVLHDGTRPIRITQKGIFQFNQNPLSSFEQEEISPRDFFVDHLLTNLRSETGIDLSRIEKIFGRSGIELLIKLEQYWLSRSLVLVKTKTHLAFDHKSRVMLDPILADSLEIVDDFPDLNKLKLDWSIVESES